ncbi:MAG: FHA domain-containing protein [Desulfosarcina sp.]|nr:FHA domain-containing protein [Desulfobacterales bacterium]
MKHAPDITIQIVHIQGPMLGEIQEFFEPEISIGRLSTCHVKFPKDLTIVSRTHAKIVREGNRFKFIDQSTNGSFINGKKIGQAYLQDGDVLMLAEGGPKFSFLTKVVEHKQKVKPELEQKPIKEPEEAVMIDASSANSDWTKKSEASVPEPSTSVPTPPEPEKANPVSAHRVKASLVIQYGPTIKSFNELPVTLGKDQACDIIIDHPAILDNHAQFFFIQNGYWIKDLTGKHIISLNGEPVNLQAALIPDARIALTPSGPFFKFINGGRLLEIEETVLNAPGEPESGDNEVNITKEDNKDSMKRGKSIFKKVLKSLDAIQKLGRS